jgi:prephenate dehydrogenase
MNNKTIGVIGLGNFGTLAALHLARDTRLKVIGYDVRNRADLPVEQVDLATVAAADIVILAVPLEAYPATLEALGPLLAPETLVVDICSVKMYTEQYIEQYLPNHPNVLFTHPLFGPQSASETTQGHALVVTGGKGDKIEPVLAYCEETLGLTLHRMSGEEHDKIMASVHVLTFFVGRGLSNLHLPEGPFITPSYTMIMDLIALDHKHSDELFRTIQDGNPFAEEMRHELVHSFQALADELSKEGDIA